MKKIVMSWAVAMVAVAGLSASANATLVTFNLNGDGGRLGNAYTFSSDGYDMTARAQEEVDTGWINRRNVYQTNRGLGVKGEKSGVIVTVVKLMAGDVMKHLCSALILRFN